MEERLISYIIKAKTRLIFIDEIHNMISEGRGYRLSSAADKTMKFLKNLSNKTNANIILIAQLFSDGVSKAGIGVV